MKFFNLSKFRMLILLLSLLFTASMISACAGSQKSRKAPCDCPSFKHNPRINGR